MNAPKREFKNQTRHFKQSKVATDAQRPSRNYRRPNFAIHNEGYIRDSQNWKVVASVRTFLHTKFKLRTLKTLLYSFILGRFLNYIKSVFVNGTDGLTDERA